MAHRLTIAAALRTAAALGLVLVVSAAHLGVTGWVGVRLARLDAATPPMQRIEVAYVREMAFTAPSRTAAAPPAPRRRAAAVRPAPHPASAPAVEEVPQEEATTAVEPDAAASSTVDAEAVAAAASTPAAPAASAVEPAVGVASAAEPAAAAAVFEWPVSTRLRYLLTGNVRGEVHGQAQVEWIRAGERYQVHLDVQVGPGFAPLATRRMSSEGEIRPEGLVPRRYEQETRLAFGQSHRATLRFDDTRVWLANGAAVPQADGVQDTASQFVQLAYLFDREPERLRVGAVVEVMLAMPRNVSAWVYDVVEEELLHTPFGAVPTYHLKPRREPRAGGDLVTELWIAPQLRHLPIRFVIRQDAENHVDLMLDQRPELAGPPAPPAPSSSTPP